MKHCYQIKDGEVVYQVFEDKARPGKSWKDNPYPRLKELKKPDGYTIEPVK